MKLIDKLVETWMLENFESSNDVDITAHNTVEAYKAGFEEAKQQMLHLMEEHQWDIREGFIYELGRTEV